MPGMIEILQSIFGADPQSGSGQPPRLPTDTLPPASQRPRAPLVDRSTFLDDAPQEVFRPATQMQQVQAPLQQQPSAPRNFLSSQQTTSQPQATAQQTAKPKGHIGPDLGDFINTIGIGLMLSDPQFRGAGQMMLGQQQKRQEKAEERQRQNKTLEHLQAKGVGSVEAEFLASNPDALRAWFKEDAAGNQPDWHIKRLINDEGQEQDFMVDMKSGRKSPLGGAVPRKPNLVNAGDGQIYDADSGKFILAPNAGPKPTDDLREYEAAKAQGFPGTFMDYQIKMKEAGRSQVNIDTGEKLPTGYRWMDNNDRAKGVEPIPGGPATQIPGELAARIGMADSFIEQAPGLRKSVADGKLTGVWDANMAKGGVGEQGQYYRQLQSGADALMRLLTGAGMNKEEATQYAERYLPTARDTAKSASQKIDQLVRELEAAKGMAMRGRGGAPTSAPPLSGDGVNLNGYTIKKVQ